MTMSPTARAQAGAQARARRAWADLGARARTVTPQAVGRAVLAITALTLAGWVVTATWPAVLPFIVGAVLAYAVLPIANRLDTVMPRVLAALLAEVVALAVLVGAFAVIVPPVLRGLVQVALRLPTADEIRRQLTGLETQLGDLPEPMRSIVLDVTTEVVARLSAAIDGLVAGAATFITDQMLGILGTVSFVVGLLVIPVWILTVVADEGNIKRRAGRLIAPAIRPDVIAVVRIVDRALSSFLRGQVLLALTSGVLIWLGLQVASTAGIGEFPYAATGGALLGILQLIPELGFFLGFFPILLVLAIAGPGPALVVTIVYVGAVKIADAAVGGRVRRGILDVHPGLLIPGIVVLSEFGIGWLLFAAPAIAIARDVVRYLYGRLSEPAAPAGVLPGERRRSRQATSAVVPSVYRTAAARPAATAAATTATATATATTRSAVP